MNDDNGHSRAVVPLPTRMILSALAGIGAVNVCHPLDVIRIHMQQLHHHPHQNRGMWHTARSIYAEAGLAKGLYAGISAAYIRQVLYGSCRMGIYSYLLDHHYHHHHHHHHHQQQQQQQQQRGAVSLKHKLLMGSIAGSIGAWVGTPAEVALVRMSVHPQTYTSVYDCWRRLVQAEGVGQLWRGATPTVVRAILVSACSLGITSEVKEQLSASEYFGEQGQWLQGYPVLFLATTISSFFANLVSTPFDVLKSRYQNHTVSGYKSVWDCFVKSIRAHGFGVLWKGFTPAFVKLAPYSIISLTLLDKMSLVITGKDAL
ncbi:solute carrier family 25 (mitochondrial oxoglutarate transporter), member 11 [Fistulifera solaris]|uniref:Solute carrier family 25 (Mitochondrial oxoglutarate transporter), member 11 n=1 Tax=Fistulifera solaris TaxID=1519565 RepID=A0A1Z5K7V1_FISSO|nr:solute carrier family 25 (mitochondrial oxoglutarate transporter), member 11 [Fistulifera solaris]|eukprot:GAX22181.1 solute carrier family 25 (mitochondrial oxoglutarate transporter), member 11 [Fistulifera solaris]